MSGEQIDVETSPGRRSRALRALVVLAVVVLAALLVALVWTAVYAATREDTAVQGPQARPAAYDSSAAAREREPPVEVAPGVFAARGLTYEDDGDADLGVVGGVPVQLRVAFDRPTDTYRVTPLGSDVAPLAQVVAMLSDDQGESTRIGAAIAESAQGTAALELADVPATLGLDARVWLWIDRASPDGATLVQLPSFPVPSTPEARGSAGFSLMYLYVATAASGLEPRDATVVFDRPDGTVRAQDCAPDASKAQCEETLGAPGFFDDFRAAQARWGETHD